MIGEDPQTVAIIFILAGVFSGVVTIYLARKGDRKT